MVVEQAAHQCVPLAARRKALPVVDHLRAIEPLQAIQLSIEPGGIGKEMPVFVREERDPRLASGHQQHAFAPAHRVHHGFGNLQLADFF